MKEQGMLVAGALNHLSDALVLASAAASSLAALPGLPASAASSFKRS